MRNLHLKQAIGSIVVFNRRDGAEPVGAGFPSPQRQRGINSNGRGNLAPTQPPGVNPVGAWLSPREQARKQFPETMNGYAQAVDILAYDLLQRCRNDDMKGRDINTGRNDIRQLIGPGDSKAPTVAPSRAPGVEGVPWRERAQQSDAPTTAHGIFHGNMK